MLRQITPSLCTQSERHGYIMTIIIVIIIIMIMTTIILIIILIIIIIIIIIMNDFENVTIIIQH